MKSNIEAYIQWRKHFSHSLTLALETKQNTEHPPGSIWVMLYAVCLFEKNYIPIHFDARSVDFQVALENFNKKINLNGVSVRDALSGRVGDYIQNHQPEAFGEFIQELKGKQLAKPCYVEKVKLFLEETGETGLMSLTFPSQLVKNYFLGQFGKMQSLFFNPSGMEARVSMKASIAIEKTTGDLIIGFPTSEILATFHELFWRTVEVIGAMREHSPTVSHS